MAQTTISIDKLTLLKDAYNGTGGFEDGSYLFQHKRETSDSFTTRKSACYYLNYMQPVVNSHVTPIFRKEPARDTSDAMLQLYLANVDTKGTPMTDFMKSAGFASKLMGTCAIVTDNMSSDKMSSTVADAQKNRQCPYSYVVTKDNFVKWKLDRFGNLLYFVYKEPLDDPNDAQVDITQVAQSVKQDSTSDSDNYQYHIWTQNDWAITDKDGGIISQGTHGLGRVPVTLLQGKPALPSVIDITSEFFQIARTNLRLFNLCSELDELLRGQAFSILVYPSKDPGALTVGVNNALGFDGTESRFAPTFITPNAGPSEWMMSHIDRLIQEMYRMAMLTHLTTGTSEARTGAAKSWDFDATNKVLADFAQRCYYAEMDVARTFFLWMKKDITNLEYQVNYSNDFSISNTSQELTEAAQALKLQIGGQFDVEVRKKTARSVLRDVPGADLQAVLDEIAAGQGAQATSSLGADTSIDVTTPKEDPTQPADTTKPPVAPEDPPNQSKK